MIIRKIHSREYSRKEHIKKIARSALCWLLLTVALFYVWGESFWEKE